MRITRLLWFIVLAAAASRSPAKSLSSPPAGAVLQPGPLPPSFRARIPAPRQFSLAPLSRAEQSILAEPDTLPRTGVHRRLEPNALAHGSWDTTADGRRVWRVVVRSPGSTGIRVHFSDFSVGSGRVWIHDLAHAAGPYTNAASSATALSGAIRSPRFLP